MAVSGTTQTSGASGRSVELSRVSNMTFVREPVQRPWSRSLYTQAARP